MIFLKYFFSKSLFLKKFNIQQKNMKNYPVGNELMVMVMNHLKDGCPKLAWNGFGYSIQSDCLTDRVVESLLPWLQMVTD